MNGTLGSQTTELTITAMLSIYFLYAIQNGRNILLGHPINGQNGTER
jgi:hypothetical protein